MVEKPAGLLAHPTKPGGPRTLWDGLRELLAAELASGGNISILNRLDRETSGVVLVAKNADAARHASVVMARREIRKHYLAVCSGWPRWQALTVKAPLLRLGEVAHSRIWLKRAVHPSGREAVTRFRILDRYWSQRGGRFALVEAFPLTGRTHQIRVHLAHAGHAVLGDKIYGPDESLYLQFIETGWTVELQSKLVLPRHALHSHAIGWTEDDKEYHWRSPLPADMAGLLTDACRAAPLQCHAPTPLPTAGGAPGSG